MDALRVGPRLELPAAEFTLRFSRSSGPGGQNVNKVETRVELRFDVTGSATLSDAQKERIALQLASRLTRSGELIVAAEDHRERARNLEQARLRMADLLARALEVPRKRKATKPTRGSQKRRLEAKRQHGERKRERRRRDLD